MEPIKEGFFAKLSAIGQVISVIVAVIGVLVAVIGVAISWYHTQNRVDVTEVPRPAATPRPDPGRPGRPPSPSGHPAEPGVPQERDTPEPSAPPNREHPVLPLDFTLRNGEQKTFLGDRASVAAEFNQIGSEEFVTLRVGTSDGESVPHAVLNAGARYSFRLAESDYSVYVLSVDKTARTVGVRISRNSESQEKRGQ